MEKTGSAEIVQISQGLRDVEIISTSCLVRVPLILAIFKDILQKHQFW